MRGGTPEELEAYFLRAWGREPRWLGLDKTEALARFRRFEVASRGDVDAALAVAKQDTADLYLRQGPLIGYLDTLLRARNPSRACKLYAGTLTSWTARNGWVVTVVGAAASSAPTAYIMWAVTP